ncbi:MAG: RNA polymerase sigma factor [Prevotellaceae bacterium]|jgi:RNA polymerase sigma-70 factor (ECF subfamily)|nr:RNA polymerase sigma factor [Prevotellaceae bacterium]
MKTISVQNQTVSADATVSLSNQELYEQHVVPYSRLIYWVCIKYSANRCYIEDNYHEALIELHRCIHTYSPERGNMKTWLCSIVKYTVWNMNRKHRRHSHSNTAYEYDLSQIADDYYRYDVESSRKADYLTNYRLLFSDDILEALEQLSPILRETLLLYLSGYKLREIADISYKSGNLKLEYKNAGTIKSRLYEARKHMRRMIDENGNKRRV